MNKWFLCLFTSLLIFSCQNGEEKGGSTLTGKVESKVQAPWYKDAAIYEVNVRQFTESGSIATITRYLPLFVNMEVDILWLMPIYPIGEKKRKGSLGSPYSVKDYKAVNPELGTMEDLKELVRQAHDKDMKVILDWVANHTAWDNQMIIDHPGWYTKDEQGNFISPVEDWSDVVDLNFDNQELRKYMIDAMKFWVEEADIDGFRCDVAGMVPLDFWADARKELEKIKPMFMLAEAEGPEFHESFEMTYAWEGHHLMNKIAKGESQIFDLLKYLQNNSNKYDKSDILMNFTTNHDENSWNGTTKERLGDAALTWAALTYFLPGMPMIYSGQETGLDRRLKFFERDPIDFTNTPHAMFYKELNALKTAEPALWNGEYGGTWHWLGADYKNGIALMRAKGDSKVFGLFNVADTLVSVNYTMEDHPGIYQEYPRGEEFTLTGGALFDIKPHSYRLFRKVADAKAEK